MEQIQRPRNSQQRAHKKRRKAKKKAYAKLYLFLLLFIIFALGFLLGLWVGTKNSKAINFVMAPASNDSPEKKGKEEDNDNTPLPWNLTLVNFENALPEDFEPESLAEVDNGYVADSRIADATKEMIADAREEDVRIIAISAYRDYEYQTDLYEKKVKRLQDEKGYSVEKAREEAKTVVAYPGTSEHQLGLALDLVDARHVELDTSQENTDAYKWLKKHCQEYGFIVRYPNGKTDITGIIYEPWHFRYVGKEAADFIMEHEITLEEYLTDYYNQ